MRKRIAAIVAAVSLGILGFATPAFATGPGTACSTAGQSDPNESAANGQTAQGDCKVTGTLTVGATWAIATDFTTFTVHTSTPATFAGDVYVQSNDVQNQAGGAGGAGYTITEEMAPLTGSAGTIPISDINGGSYQPPGGGLTTTPTYQPLPFGADAFVPTQTDGGAPSTGTVNDACQSPATNWDCYGVPDYYLNVSANSISPGTYTTTVDFDLWQN